MFMKFFVYFIFYDQATFMTRPDSRRFFIDCTKICRHVPQESTQDLKT